MSDTSQGPGWWQASDGRWYPPEATPGPTPPAGPEPQWGPPDAGQTATSPGYGYAPPSIPPPGGQAPPGWGPGAGPPAAGPGWAQPGYGQPPPQQQRSNRGLWIALSVILGIIVLGVGGCIVAVAVVGNAIGDTVTEAIDDFGIDFTNGVPATGPTSCTVTGVDSFDEYDVDVSATNDSGVRSAYRINYELFDPQDASLGTDYGIISAIDPGDTVTDDAFGILDAGPDWTQVRCEVTSALRIPVT